MLDNTPSQPAKFRTKYWVEINDDSRGKYNINSQIKFKNSMLRSRLCDYSDVYILVSGNIIVKNCAPFTNCISETNNKKIDNASVMPMYDLIEYSDNYFEISESLWQYYIDEPLLIFLLIITTVLCLDRVPLKYLSNF